MTEAAMAFLAAGLGAAGAVLGGALGIGLIGKGTVESIARQPEATTDIRSVMIITAGMVEGLALLALVISFLLSFK
ncbi:MAG: ATP synthase F0 subunit C [Calditrichaeota bacterium]|nr:ATP synthase F0 subunit C [Calditrichota bacterium]